MCDIVLVRPNDKKAIYGTLPDSSTASDPPYWLALMGGYLNEHGINVKLIDAENESQSPSETAAIIRDIAPKLVGIIPLGSNVGASTWKMNGGGILSSELKNTCPELPQFIWGYHVSAIPKRTLQDELVDYVVTGEGFATVAQLFEELTGQRRFGAIKGLWRRDNGRVVGTFNPQFIDNLDELPVNGWELLPNYGYRNHLHFSLEDLSKRDRYGAVLTSMGCPYNCSYCAIRFFSGDKRVRYKSADRVADEAEYLVNNFGVYYLRILDECFTTNKKHVFEVCEAIAKRKLDVSIWVYARVEHITEQILSAMATAGIKWLGIGIETGSQAIRDNVYKGQYTETNVKEVVDMAKGAGISICDNYMFGLPGDTVDTMRETLELARELNCGYPNMYCTMAYPGSQLYKDALESGIDLPESWLGYAQLSYETKPLPTETLSSAEVLRFRDYAFNTYFENNEPYWNMIHEKFGQQAVDAIQKVLQGKLKRKLLGD